MGGGNPVTIRSLVGASTGIDQSRFSILSANPSVLNGDFESIATVTVSGTSTTSVLFDNIPSSFQHLQVRGLVKRQDSTNGGYLGMRVNGDTGSNYTAHALGGNGSSAMAYGTTALNNGLLYITADSGFTSRPVVGSGTAELFSAFVYDLLDYTSTTKNKTARGFIGYDANGSGFVQIASGAWLSTSAVTSLTLWMGGDTMYAASTFALYGIKAP